MPALPSPGSAASPALPGSQARRASPATMAGTPRPALSSTPRFGAAAFADPLLLLLGGASASGMRDRAAPAYLSGHAAPRRPVHGGLLGSMDAAIAQYVGGATGSAAGEASAQAGEAERAAARQQLRLSTDSTLSALLDSPAESSGAAAARGAGAEGGAAPEELMHRQECDQADTLSKQQPAARPDSGADRALGSVDGTEAGLPSPGAQEPAGTGAKVAVASPAPVQAASGSGVNLDRGHIFVASAQNDMLSPEARVTAGAARTPASARHSFGPAEAIRGMSSLPAPPRLSSSLSHAGTLCAQEAGSTPNPPATPGSGTAAARERLLASVVVLKGDGLPGAEQEENLSGEQAQQPRASAIDFLPLEEQKQEEDLLVYTAAHGSGDSPSLSADLQHILDDALAHMASAEASPARLEPHQARRGDGDLAEETLGDLREEGEGAAGAADGGDGEEDPASAEEEAGSADGWEGDDELVPSPSQLSTPGEAAPAGAGEEEAGAQPLWGVHDNPLSAVPASTGSRASGGD